MGAFDDGIIVTRPDLRMGNAAVAKRTSRAKTVGATANPAETTSLLPHPGGAWNMGCAAYG